MTHKPGHESRPQNGNVIGFWCEQIVPPQSPVQPKTPQGHTAPDGHTGSTGNTGTTGNTGDTSDNTGDTGKTCRDCSGEDWIHIETYCMSECCGYEDCWPSNQQTDTDHDQDDSDTGQVIDEASSPGNFIDVGCPPCCAPIVLC